VNPGGIIRTRTYQMPKRSPPDPRTEPDGVFIDMDFKYDDIDGMLDIIRHKVALVRMGEYSTTPHTEYCGYCKIGLHNCNSLLKAMKEAKANGKANDQPDESQIRKTFLQLRKRRKTPRTPFLPFLVLWITFPLIMITPSGNFPYLRFLSKRSEKFPEFVKQFPGSKVDDGSAILVDSGDETFIAEPRLNILAYIKYFGKCDNDGSIAAVSLEPPLVRKSYAKRLLWMRSVCFT
jgi:hypothetical protein